MPSAQGPELLQLPQVDHTQIQITGFMTIIQATPLMPGGPWQKLPTVLCDENGPRASWPSQCCWQVCVITVLSWGKFKVILFGRL